MKNNGTLLGIAVAILLAFLFRDWIKAGVRELMSSSPVEAPAVRAREPVRQEQQPGPSPEQVITVGASPLYQEPTPNSTPTPPEIGQTEKPRYDKCSDGSALTITSRDANQTNYRCGSGRIGAYSN